MAGSTTTSEEVVQKVILVPSFPKLQSFWKRNISMFVAFLIVIASMAVGGAVVYYKTATKQVCHTRHILGIIPDGRACTTEPRF